MLFFANSFNAAKGIDSGMQSHLFLLHEKHGSELYHNYGTYKTNIQIELSLIVVYYCEISYMTYLYIIYTILCTCTFITTDYILLFYVQSYIYTTFFFFLIKVYSV